MSTDSTNTFKVVAVLLASAGLVVARLFPTMGWLAIAYVLIVGYLSAMALVAGRSRADVQPGDGRVLAALYSIAIGLVVVACLPAFRPLVSIACITLSVAVLYGVGGESIVRLQWRSLVVLAAGLLVPSLVEVAIPYQWNWASAQWASLLLDATYVVNDANGQVVSLASRDIVADTASLPAFWRSMILMFASFGIVYSRLRLLACTLSILASVGWVLVGDTLRITLHAVPVDNFWVSVGCTIGVGVTVMALVHSTQQFTSLVESPLYGAVDVRKQVYWDVDFFVEAFTNCGSTLMKIVFVVCWVVATVLFVLVSFGINPGMPHG